MTEGLAWWQYWTLVAIFILNILEIFMRMWLLSGKEFKLKPGATSGFVIAMDTIFIIVLATMIL